MHIVAVGLNHNRAAVGLRERLAFQKGRLQEAYSALRNYSSMQEALILSTCNRVEIYGIVDNPSRGIKELKEFLSSFKQVSLEDFEEKLYIYFQPKSVNHLFSVASGLDSMVIGETQILVQLKEAYFNAYENNSIGKILDYLLQKAFRTTRKVRNSTNISRGAVSASSVAVRLIEEVMGDLSQRKVMIVGAGKMSELAMKYLMSKGVSSTLVSNRTYEKARMLATSYKGEAIGFDRLMEFLVNVDILITSTGAPHLVIRKKEISELMRKRQDHPLFLIDLAVPRDIDPAVREIKSVHLYDIDDLQKVVEKNIQLRQKEMPICSEIIERKTSEFMDWLETPLEVILK